MAMLKFGHASVSTPVVCPGKWTDRMTPKGRVVTAKDVIAKYDPSKWLLSHVTIMASVDVDLADPSNPKSNYLIKPEYSIFVNNNGDSWERGLLKQASQTFIGADNFVEHVQIPELSKGKIIDLALRDVTFAKDKNGNDLNTLYVDILIATNKKHTDLIEKIQSGEYNAVSMGCGLAGTKIILPNGSLYNIEEIKVGDLVLTHTGQKKPVTKLFSTHVTDIPLFSVDYVGASELLRLTGEHPILIASESSVRCTYQKEVCRIDKEQNKCYWESKKRGKVKVNCGRDKNSYSYDFKFVPISEVSKGDYIVRVFPTEEKNNDTFNEDLCRLLGVYAGDGYIGWQWSDISLTKKEKDYPAYVGFCLGLHEENLIKEVKDILNRVVEKGTTITEKVAPERNGFYINVYDKKLASLFYEHCGEGSHNKSFSETIMTLPKKKQLLIISGMIDTDGGYYEKDKNIYYTSSSSDLINQVHLILLRNKISNARERVLRKGSGKKAHIEKYYEETISVSKSFSYLIPCNKNKSFNIKPEKIQENCFFFNNYYLSRITSITQLRFSGTVYNFSVEEDESYSVNNAAVHNCLIKYSQCSQCGRIAEDESQACKHVRYFKNNFFYDKNGVRRIVAELCGRAEEPDSCKFMDASWVRKPAFEGAVKNKILELDSDLSEKLQKAVSFPSFEYQPGMYLKAASQAAMDIANEIEAQEEEAPKPPADDVNFPEAPPESKKPLETDIPSEDAPLGESEAPDSDSLGDLGAPGEGAPGGGAPEPQIEEPKEDATVQEVKDLVKNQILNEIRREILKEQATETATEQRPTDLENSTNNNLVKDASFKKIFASAKKSKNDRLYNGLVILSNLKNWNQFKRYGYNRDDVLGILHFVDKNISTIPVGADAVKTLSKIKLGSDGFIPFFTKMIVEIGRKPSSVESKKIASWAKILTNF